MLDDPMMAMEDGPEKKKDMGAAELAELQAMLSELRKREVNDSRGSAKFYPKQKEFMLSDAGVTIMLAGNQTGKSHCAAYAIACDLEGIYPDWWTGPRTKTAPRVWCVGVTNESTRDNCQFKLWGPDYETPGGGWIDPEKIVKWTRRSGVAGAIDTIWVKHVSGDLAMCTFKANEMGRTKLQGPSLDRIWCDEEIDKDVFDELMFRTIARPGSLIRVTFTALKGYTELVLSFMDQEDGTNVKLVRVRAADVKHEDGTTHMTEERRERIKKMYANEPHLLQARIDGEPTQGAGLIYPDVKHLFVKPFKIESWWPRLGGMDFGWRHPTVAMVAAYDRDADCIYVYGMHNAIETDPATHLRHISKWGDVDFACDPAGFQSDKTSGVKLIEEYNRLLTPGWKPHWDEKRWRVFPADNAVSMGIAKVRDRIETERIFFFDTPEFELLRKEFSLYKYDEESNKPMKKHDDALDALRYLVVSVSRARLQGKTLNPLNDGSIPPNIPQWKRRPEGY